ncbi:MAG: cellulose binding domain-containing protein [Bryobacteraceae bacterium]
MTSDKCVYSPSRQFSAAALLLVLAVLATPAVHAQTVTYRTTSDWGAGFNGQITVKNDAAVPLRAWQVDFDFARKIENIWDARIVERSGNRYRVRSAGWNDSIEPGQSVSFGFTGSPGEVKEGPANAVVVAGSEGAPGATPVPPAPTPGSTGANAIAAIRETGRWTGGFSATITITNRSATQEIRRWTLRFRLDASIDSAWGGTYRRDGDWHEISAGSAVEAIAAGGSVVVGFTGSPNLENAAAGSCTLNGGECAMTVARFVAATQRPPIAVSGDEEGKPVTQWLLSGGATAYKLSSPAGGAVFRATSSNPSVARVAVHADLLTVHALQPGRAFVRIDDLAGGASRAVGIRVNGADGEPPGLPPYVALGSVSEDTTADLGFWRGIESVETKNDSGETVVQPGRRNKRIDIRYIYLNGGPVNGWDTWGNGPGSRAVNYIRNSRMLGIVPYFVFYNIPDGSESYERDLEHAQSLSYMTAYFANLRLFLDIVRRESPGDTVGVILEPDFLGYLAQNAGRAPADIPAATRGAYDSGLLGPDDPAFPDNIRGLVEAINYSISKYAPRVEFGWQMNLWASPPGGFTTSIPGRGIIRKTDQAGIDAGRQAIALEAAAITRFYLDAGIATHGARFVSIDKYGLDAGAEPGAAANPAESIWFWNNDHWLNYLAFVRAMHETSGLPVVLWQLPVGRINGTRESNPYSSEGTFPDLPNAHRLFEDSAPTFFFGDTFAAAEPRASYFASNASADPGLAAGEGVITWSSHIRDAAQAGVRVILFGAGVGASTSSVGEPPSDSYWWITKAQNYYNDPAPIQE